MDHKFDEDANDVAHKKRWQTFEGVFGIPFLIGIVLEIIVPLSLPAWIPPFIVIVVGIILMILGVVLIVYARRELTQNDQPIEPGQPTNKLVTTGVFSISRNPIYLGGVCFLAGFGLALNLVWVLLFLLPALIACHYVLIAPEEQYLAATFGDEYRTYAASVYRWIGRSRPEESD